MNPFDEILDKSFLYLDADREMALASIGNAVEQGQGVALCIGSSGIGKTAILTYLAEDLVARGCIVANDGQILTCRPTLTFDEIEEIVRQSSAVDEKPSAPEVDRAYPMRALLVDDIERLSTVALEHLSNWWRETAPLRETMTLVATAERKRTNAFAPSTIEAVEAAADVRLTLKAMSRTDTEALIQHRLAAAGYQETALFTPSALDQVAFYGRGNPRRILQLCRAVFALAHAQGDVPVSPELVKTCAHEVFLPPRLKDLARSTHHHEFDADATNSFFRSTHHSSLDFGSTPVSQNPLIEEPGMRHDGNGLAPSTADSNPDHTDDTDDTVVAAPMPGGIASVAEPPTKRPGSSRPRIVYALTGVAFALGVFAGVAGTFLRNDDDGTAARAKAEAEREQGANKAPETETKSDEQAHAERVAMAERMVAEALKKEEAAEGAEAADAMEPVGDATGSDAASTTTDGAVEKDRTKDIVEVETGAGTPSSLEKTASLEEKTVIATTADPSVEPAGRQETEPQLATAHENTADQREASDTVPEASLPDGRSAHDGRLSTSTVAAPETRPVTVAENEAAAEEAATEEAATEEAATEDLAEEEVPEKEVATEETAGEAIVADARTAPSQPDEPTPDSSNSEAVGEMATMAGGSEVPVPLPASNAAISEPAAPIPEPATVVTSSQTQPVAPIDVETLPTAETIPESRRPVTTGARATNTEASDKTAVAIENTVDTRAPAPTPASDRENAGDTGSPPDTIVASLPADAGIATPTGLSETEQEETFVYDPRVRTAQLLLAQLGYKPGPVDGYEGKKTEAAIRLFQRSKGIAETGSVTDGLIVALRKELVPRNEPAPVASAPIVEETKLIEADTTRTEEAETDFFRECSRQQKQWIYVESLGRYIFCKRFQFNPTR